MTIVNLGTANDPGGVAGFSRITVATGCSVGTLLHVIAPNSGATAGAVSDSAGNTYVLSVNIGTSFSGSVFSCRLKFPLTGGVDTITYTPPGGASSSISAYNLINVQGSSTTVQTSGTSATPTISNTFSPGDLAVGVVCYAPSSEGIAVFQSPGFSSPPNAIAGSTSSPGIIAGNTVATGSGTLVYAPTIAGGSDDWIAFFFDFPPSFAQVNALFVMPYRVRRAPIASTLLYYRGQAQDVAVPLNDAPSGMVIYRLSDGDWLW